MNPENTPIHIKSLLPEKWRRAGKWAIAVFVLYFGFMHIGNRRDIKRVLYNKAEIKIPYWFYILENEINHSPYAIDSDYTWNFEITLSESVIDEIKTNIEESKSFIPKEWAKLPKIDYDSLRNNGLKGFWGISRGKYHFYETNEPSKSEMTSITLDPKKLTISVTVVHI